MATTSNGLQLTVKEAAYLAYHVGWRSPDLEVIVAIGTRESELNSNAYRPESQNPKGGRDWGLVMINDGPNAWPVPDPFTRLDPVKNLAEALTIWQRYKFAPWAYPSKPLANLAAVAIEIGPTPYAIERSPYWRMFKADMNLHDLPVPPADVYVSRLPIPSRYSQQGEQVNQLQRLLSEEGKFTGILDFYYGNRTKAGVTAKQIELAGFGLWSGPLDGQFSEAFRTCWDGAERYSFAWAGTSA